MGHRACSTLPPTSRRRRARLVGGAPRSGGDKRTRQGLTGAANHGARQPTLWRRMRVLVVEDNEDLADVIARGLRREGIAVDIAHDGGQGWVNACVYPYDVVVLDRDLPVLHGDELCR